MRIVPTRAQRGFTLVEIMVGCVIGVVGLLVIFQTIAAWNRHAQSTANGADADVAGTLAIFNIERDMKQAGMGIGTADPTLMGCPVSTTGVPAFTMAPVKITVGAGGTPDSIDVLYGNSAFFTAAQQVLSNPTPTSESLSRRNGFKQGDLAIIAGTSASGVPACSLAEITDTSNPDGFTVGNSPGVTYASYYAASGAASSTARYNPATPYPPLTSATMFSLGPGPVLNRWQIANNSVLQRAEQFSGAPAFEVAEGVINMKAEYGVDANGNGMIEDNEWTTVDPVPPNWSSVLAIRVAVLVRSSQFEHSTDNSASAAAAVVTASAPYWAHDAASHSFTMTNVDGTTDTLTTSLADAVPNNWRWYRYRVYEKVIPLRNMIW